MMRRIFCAALLAALAAGALTHAFAQERRDERREREDWRDRDIVRFHERDIERWRRGRWEHARHDGRDGWWWIVGGVWYFYPAPVYPYPDPYAPPMIAGVGPPPPLPPQAPAYYYCDNPPGYYPYVPACPSGWRPVPAAPPR
jgi:hypothetical protein